MKDSLIAGLTHQETILITADKCIDFMGDDLRVYSTPNMVADIEQTCRNLMLAHADTGEDSVGVRVEIDHLGATLAGQTVTIDVKVTGVDGPRVSFEVEVHDELDKVGQAKHVRFAMETEKQGARLRKKAAKVAELS